MQPKWLDINKYPFKSNYLQIDRQYQLHYIDEGKDEVLLFVHGTPTWSFNYRKLIKSLSADYRCIAIDHIGFGLSDKPSEYEYTTKKHSENLKLLVKQLR